MPNWPGTIIEDDRSADTQASARIPSPQASPFPGAEVQDVDRSTDLSAYAAPVVGEGKLSEDGSMEFARPEDYAYAQAAQDLLANGGKRPDFDALSKKYGFPVYGPQLDEAIAERDWGGRLWSAGVPKYGRKEPGLLAPFANTDIGAGLLAAGNAGGLGLSDEIAGLAGGDSVLDVVQGQGEAQRQAQLLKDTAAQEHPVSTTIGNVGGAITGSMGMGALSGGRRLAADTAYGAGYGAGESNDNRLGGAALGGVAAAGGSYFGGKLLDKIANRAPRAAAKTVEAGQKFGIDVPMGATGRGAAIVEKGFDNLPLSAGVMQEGRNVLTQQVDNAVEEVASTYGPTTSFSGIGEAAQSGAKKWMDRFQEVAGKAYNAIPIRSGTDSNLTNTVAALQAVNGKFSSNPELAAALNNSKLGRYLDALSGKVKTVPTGVLDAAGNPITRDVQIGGKLSWEDLKDFRSRVGEEIGDQLFSDGTLKSELRGLYGALSEDMKATAIAQGPSALRAFERANNLYKAGQDRIDGAITKLLGNDSAKSAEAAAGKIQAIARDGKASGDLATLAEVRKTLPAEEYAQIQNGVIRLLGQPANSAGREFSPETYIRNYRDMAPEAKNLFFGKGELRANLDEFSGVMDSLAKVSALRNTSNTAAALNGTGALGTVAAGLLNPILGVKLAAAGALNYSLAKLWTNPRFVKWATGYTRMVKAATAANGTPNVSKQMALLKKVAAAEPAIAQDALGLQQYLAQTFAASPQRLAAEEPQPTE